MLEIFETEIFCLSEPLFIKSFLELLHLNDKCINLLLLIIIFVIQTTDLISDFFVTSIVEVAALLLMLDVAWCFKNASPVLRIQFIEIKVIIKNAST